VWTGSLPDRRTGFLPDRRTGSLRDRRSRSRRSWSGRSWSGRSSRRSVARARPEHAADGVAAVVLRPVARRRDPGWVPLSRLR